MTLYIIFPWYSQCIRPLTLRFIIFSTPDSTIMSPYTQGVQQMLNDFLTSRDQICPVIKQPWSISFLHNHALNLGSSSIFTNLPHWSAPKECHLDLESFPRHVFHTLRIAGIINKYCEKNWCSFLRKTPGGPEVKDQDRHRCDDNSGDLCHQDMEHVIQELQNKKATERPWNAVTK